MDLPSSPCPLPYPPPICARYIPPTPLPPPPLPLPPPLTPPLTPHPYPPPRPPTPTPDPYPRPLPPKGGCNRGSLEKGDGIYGGANCVLFLKIFLAWVICLPIAAGFAAALTKVFSEGMRTHEPMRM